MVRGCDRLRLHEALNVFHAVGLNLEAAGLPVLGAVGAQCCVVSVIYESKGVRSLPKCSDRKERI